MVARLRLLLTIAFGLAVVAACGGTQPPVAADVVLTVTVNGTGTGTVTSAPAGISAAVGQTDTGEFASGTVVTLTAAPTNGSVFAGWSAPCPDLAATTCTVTMDTARTVTATFNAPAVQGDATLTVVIDAQGTAAGHVTSTPAGIEAGSTSAVFPIGTQVVLTAVTTSGFFTGWTGGDCQGVTTTTCTVTMTEGEPSVTANFRDLAVQVVNVTTGTAAGDVSNTGEEFLANSASNAARWQTGFNRATSSDLELGTDNEHASQIVALRFPNVVLPANAQIVSAVISFTAWQGDPTVFAGTGQGEPALTIRGQLSLAPTSFVTDMPELTPVSSFNISNETTRPRTGATVPWPITATWTNGAVYNSPNVATVLQEIVGQGGWTSGSPIVLFIRPNTIADVPATAPYRRAHPSGTANAPTLRIEYVVPAAP
jgi:hypothetical protein